MSKCVCLEFNLDSKDSTTDEETEAQRWLRSHSQFAAKPESTPLSDTQLILLLPVPYLSDTRTSFGRGNFPQTERGGTG